jgi:ubiquinone/menaquinone biosynthesis C-methylase UbiE
MRKSCFDKLAPWYLFLETISFGNQLQQCRISQIAELKEVKNVLILGDGNGRFLESLLKSNCNAEIESLDISRNMIGLANARITPLPNNSQVVFIHTDVFDWNFPKCKYDLIVTNFFLDCFTYSELTNLLEKISLSLKPQGKLIYGDFNVPNSLLIKTLTSLLLYGMYLFFRIFTQISANSLYDPTSLLIENKFILKNEKYYLLSFLKSQLWIKN